MIQEKDNFDPSGITYYSLRATTISKEQTTETFGLKNKTEETITVHPSVQQTLVVNETPSDISKFIPNRKITFTTQKGFFKCDVKVKIHSLTENQVVFSIPNGILNCEVQVQENYRLKRYKLEREE
jgi:hypothetical protein